jgi:hypothetical protein
MGMMRRERGCDALVLLMDGGGNLICLEIDVGYQWIQSNAFRPAVQDSDSMLPGVLKASSVQQ